MGVFLSFGCVFIELQNTTESWQNRDGKAWHTSDVCMLQMLHIYLIIFNGVRILILVVTILERQTAGCRRYWYWCILSCPNLTLVPEQGGLISRVETKTPNQIPAMIFSIQASGQGK